MLENIKASLIEAQNALDQLISDTQTLGRIEAAASAIINSFEQGHRVFSCGNGGSMCDAMHFAEELTGRYRKNRKGYPAIAISDPGHLTCVANDFGYDQIFARYIESHGNKGDCLIAISTSGTSGSCINAVKTANSLGMVTISLTGKTNTELERMSQFCIVTPGGEFADRVQELHIKILHIVIEIIERHFHPENYND